MKLKISSGYTGVISTGSYENSRPSFISEVEFDANGDKLEDVPKIVKEIQQKLQSVCYENFKECESLAIKERIEKERKDIRFYGEFPSVTSIIGWDADFFVSPEDLNQYASQGNLYDLQAKVFIETGKWEKVEDIEDAWTDLVIVKKGELSLPYNDWNFPAFLEKHPLEKMEVGTAIVCKEHKYAGTPDIRVCIYEGKRYLADIKRTPIPEKHFKQCAAYIMAEEENGEKPYDGMMLIPANGKTKQGFSKPVISEKIDTFKKAFLKDRERFKKRFGV